MLKNYAALVPSNWSIKLLEFEEKVILQLKLAVEKRSFISEICGIKRQADTDEKVGKRMTLLS